MKTGIKLIGAICLSTSLCSCGTQSAKLETIADSVSYCLGFQTAAMLNQQGFDSINNKAFWAGYKTFDIEYMDVIPLELDSKQYVDMMQRWAKTKGIEE